MLKLLLPCFTALAFAAFPDMDFGAYYVNWAQYRAKPYTYVADSVKNLAPITTRLMFSFVYFCPPKGTTPMPYWAVKPFGNCTDDTEYELMFVEPNDNTTVAALGAMKSANSKMKFIASIGGWNFPSAFWSKMSSTAENRAKFVNSAKAFLTKYKFDGIDIDWEYPTSSARDNAVKITCKQFRSVHDAGGTAADTPNIVALFKDLRGGLPTASISYAAPANVDHAKLSDVAHVANYLDYFHLMTYDYAVSDVPGATMFSPNSPLYTPPAPAVQMSIDYTVQGYLGMGIKPSQLQLGVSYYGHGWFNDEFTDASQWQKFGGKDGKVQGSCCGPFTQTYGNAPGKGSGQCGSLMYSEIVAAGFENYYDNVTQSDIGYLSKDSADGVTKKGVWITYNGPTSMQKIAEYAKKWKLAGVFAYDSSMDTLDYKAGNYTYGLSNLIAKILNNHTNDETEGTLIESDESFEMLA